ncbi:MAG: DUF4129 domain-containing protein [Acidimicrobiia bacterium]|nr:DUF4129 domain-containing protein [Acidimicrobiia bacterium]
MIGLVLAGLGALLGASTSELSPSARPWLVALVGGVMAFQAAVLQPIGAPRPRIALRLVVLVAGVKLLQLAAGRPTGVDAEFALGVAVGVAAWVAAAGTRADIDAIDRGIDVADGLTPLQRIRVRVTVWGTVSVIGAAWGVVGLGGAVDVRRPAAARMSIAPLLFFVVAIVAVGHVARRSEVRRWMRDRARVDSSVELGWSRAVMLVAGAALAAALVVPWLGQGVSAVPVRALAASGSVGDWVADRMLALGETLDTEAEPGTGGGAGPVTAPDFEPVEPAAPWLGDVALIALLAAIFTSVIIRARGRRRLRFASDEAAPGLGEMLGVFWREIVGAILSIGRALAKWFRRLRRGEDPIGADVGPGPGAPSRLRGWQPGDPVRRRIASAYRRARDTVVGSTEVPRRSVTPRELAERVGTAPFSTLTGLFEEARYSDHVMTDSQARTAENAAEELPPVD